MKQQGSLFDFPVKPTPDKPLARRSDPETSRNAAMRLASSGRLNKQEEKALELVRENPGRTGAELDKISGVSKRQISKRLAGLAEKNKIRRGDDDEVRICSVNKSKCVTWWKVI